MASWAYKADRARLSMTRPESRRDSELPKKWKFTEGGNLSELNDTEPRGQESDSTEQYDTSNKLLADVISNSDVFLEDDDVVTIVDGLWITGTFGIVVLVGVSKLRVHVRSATAVS